MKKGDAIFLAIMVLLVAGLGALFAFAPKSPVYAPVELTGSTMTATSTADYRVDAWVTLKQPGFVTIHESIGGAPGPVAATSMYLETTSVVSSIAVDPPLNVGAPYVALLHVDNGDGVFVMEEDLPVMSDGRVVRSDFAVEKAPEAE